MTNSIEDRPRTGRPRSVRTAARIKRIREKIRRNPARTIRKMAKEEGVNRESVRELVKYDLGLRPYHERKVAGLTHKQEEKRLARCKKLMKRHAGRSLKRIISDEKLFNMEECHNSKTKCCMQQGLKTYQKKNRPSHAIRTRVVSWFGQQCHTKENCH